MAFVKNIGKNSARASGFGFTLVELIVAITILSILSTIGFLSLSGYSQDAKEAALKANVRSIHAAISNESAITNQSPRYYVSHDASTALTGASAYAMGSIVSLVGGNWNDAGTNYSYGNPDWTKLKLNSEKFKISKIGDSFRTAFAALDVKLPTVSAIDTTETFPSGKKRSTSYVRVSGTSVTGLTQTAGDSAFVCPSGFIGIPGSAGIRIGNTDGAQGWCVAKWGMVPENVSGWTQDTVQNGWKCTTASDSATNPCGGDASKKVTSKPGTYPITWITRNEGESACGTQLSDSMGKPLVGGHIMPVVLWKKIADDVAQNGINWSGNSPGLGNMSRGCAKGVAYAYDNGCVGTGASMNLADGTNAGTTVGNPQTAVDQYFDKRVWQLSNGSVIHDFAGDVWGWFYDTHGNASYAWTEFTAFGNGFPTFNGMSVRPVGASWNSTQGVGYAYLADTVSGVVATGTAFSALYGGAWTPASSAGIYDSYWNSYSPSSDRRNSVGFRCVVPSY